MAAIGRYGKLLILFTLIFLITSCSSRKKEGLEAGKEVIVEKSTFSFEKSDYHFNLFPSYRIAPGDVLDVLFQIQTWIEQTNFKLGIDHIVEVKFVHAPKLSEKQKVRPDGTISLPYIGSIRVKDRKLDELTDYLKNRYSTILRDPDLYIVVPEFRSRIKELKQDLHTAPRGLSRLIYVRPDGYATFPMVGNVFVVGKTFPLLNEELNRKYGNILPGLNCDLFLHEHAGSLVYILGEVVRPGSYPIRRPISLPEALSMAGSFTSGANITSVIVVRNFENQLVARRVNMKNALSFKQEKSFFYLKPDDLIYVPKRRITRMAEIASEISEILLFRGWSLTSEMFKSPILGSEDNFQQ